MEGALLTLREAGVEVGREMSFVGCDDVVVAGVHQPPIAVVRRDIEADGRRLGGASARRSRAVRGRDRRVARDRPADGIRRPPELRAAGGLRLSRNRFRYRPQP